jgi:hypothetical protein
MIAPFFVAAAASFTLTLAALTGAGFTAAKLLAPPLEHDSVTWKRSLSL